MLENIHKFTIQNKNIFNMLIRSIFAFIILSITDFFAPNFQINNIKSLILISFILSILDYLIIESICFNTSSFIKSLLGFVLSGLILYITKYFISGYYISLIATIIGALFYGTIDYFIYNK